MDQILTLLHRYLIGAWRRRWLALAGAWLLCVGGWVGVVLMPNQYEASTRLYVDADAVLTPLLRGLAIDSTPANQVDLLQRTLLSRPNLEKLISKTDLDLLAPDPVRRNALIEQLAAAIRIQSQTNNLFTITYRNTRPRLAYDVVQTLITLFIESATGTNRSQMQNAARFVDAQIAEYEAKLREAEHRRADFQAKYMELLPSDANGGVGGLEAARAQVTQLDGELADAIAKRDMLAQDLHSNSPLQMSEAGRAALQHNAGAAAADPDLLAAEKKLRELRLKYTDDHPDVIAARRLVEALKAAPYAGAGAGAGGGAHGGGNGGPNGGHGLPNGVYDQIKVRLLDAEATVNSLKRQRDDAIRSRDRLAAVVRNEPGLQAEYMDLDRDYSVLRKTYEELLSRREVMRLSSAADTDADKLRLQIIDPPQMPRVPAAPKRMLLMAGVLVAGLGGGAGLALLLAHLDSCFYTTNDLRALGLPVLGGISLTSHGPRRAAVMPLVTFGVGVVLLVFMFGAFITGPHWFAAMPGSHWLARFV